METKVAVINSRQSKRMLGNDEWIKMTLKAVDDWAERNVRFIASPGMRTYEWVLWRAGVRKAPVLVVLPLFCDEDREEKQQWVKREFGLNDSLTQFAVLPFDYRSQYHKRAYLERDREVCRLADWIIPVSIRPGGNWDSAIGDMAGDKIVEDYRVPYEGKSREYGKDNAFITPPDFGDYLTHWTHSQVVPYSGETWSEFYASLADFPHEDRHSAFHALRRMLREKTIRGSGREIRSGLSVVSFSENPPHQLGEMRQWRGRKTSYSVEPYGIAFDRQTLMTAGVRPVIYGDGKEYRDLSSGEKPFFQNRGKDGRWAKEREWRRIGDWDFSSIPPDKIQILVRDDGEAAELSREFPLYRVSPICT